MNNRRYTKAFKEQAMRLVTVKEYPVATAARELGIPESTLTKWLTDAGWKRHVEGDGPPLSDDAAVLKTQIKELQRRLKRSEMEKEILKKATAYFASQNLSASPSSTTSEEGSSR
jgi:transposase